LDAIYYRVMENSAQSSQEKQTGTLIRNKLKHYGLRYSKPREAILSVFGERDRHISAEGLYQELKDRGEDLSLSTVYLNLSVLSKAGLLREFQGGNGETVFDNNTSPHDHLVCKDCGAVTDIPLTYVADASVHKQLHANAKRYAEGWNIDKPDLILHARCLPCL